MASEPTFPSRGLRFAALIRRLSKHAPSLKARLTGYTLAGLWMMQDDPGQATTLLEWVIRPALRTVPGVADVNVLGGYARSYEVVPDPMRMAARGVDALQLEAAVAANNRNDGAGRINEGEEALLVRSEGRIEDTTDVERIVVRVENGIPISVADVATVKIGSITRYGAVTESGGTEAVEGLVLGLRGGGELRVRDPRRLGGVELDPSLDPAEYPFRHGLRVRFAQTDAMGIVHHSRYLPYLEEARVEYLRDLGHPYSVLREEGIDFAVLEAFVQYRQPLRFDDRVMVHLHLGSATRATFQIAYLLTVDDEVRATAVTVHGCVNAQGKPVRMPEWLRAMVTSQPAP